MSYWRFAAMITTSTVVMYGLMYLNTYAFEHVFWSETRAWMALVMGATMAVIMLGYMLGMYRKRALNLAIFAGAIAVFALSLWLVRSQATVDDAGYMKAMIPHHSIAILTSKRAQVSDPRVRKLADEIIEAQEREISEMKYLIGDPAPDDELAAIHAPQIAELAPAGKALAGAYVPHLDPANMNDAEIRKVLGAGPHCTFGYTSDGKPVLGVQWPANGAGAKGAVKLNGHLVALSGAAKDGVLALSGDRVRMTLVPEGSEAVLVFEVGDELRVGYRGYYTCLEAA